MGEARYRGVTPVQHPEHEASELGCGSWVQFSFKYILALPAVTCALTAATNPAHMGPPSTEATKWRTRELAWDC